MARIFTDSFEGANLLQWSERIGGDGTITASPTLDGSYCVYMNGGTFTSVALYYTLNPALTEVYVGFFIRSRLATWAPGHMLFELCNGTNQVVGITFNGSSQLVVHLNNSGTVACTGIHTLSFGTNYHVQLYAKIHSSSGVVTLRLDDSQECTFSGNTDPGGRTNFDNFCLGSRARLAEIQNYFDNVVVNDTTGGVENSWPGIARFAVKTVVGPGFYVNNWSRNTAPDNWSMVDEIPNDGDTTYLYTQTSNIYESFSVTSPNLTLAHIRAIRTMAIVKKDTGTVKLAVGIRDLDNSTDYFTTAANVGVSYGFLTDRRIVDPSTSLSWTQAGLGALQPLIISSE